MILLDEIDKMGQDFRGDPASAMLEVLDPEQNATFSDHYLEVEYDLSNVMFLTTANSYNMPGPLLDRMEIIPLSGYTEDEKCEIAKRHLLSKQLKNHGLKDGELALKEDALSSIIQRYTREAGVRNLEREIAKIARKAVTKIVKKEVETLEVTADNISDFLGVEKFRYGLAEKEDQVGVVTGLAWTSVGGDLLSIEALKLPGKGRMKTTGKLGDVMKESIDAASSYVRSISPKIGVKPTLFDRLDIHVHVPEGNPKRWTKRWLSDGNLHRVGFNRDSCTQRHRNDGRSNIARQCFGHWWIKGKTARGAARRHHNGFNSARE